MQAGNIYPGGSLQQAGTINLFQTELAVRQLFPVEFDEFDLEEVPDVPKSEQLFDRGRSSIGRCAYLENHLDFLAGIDVRTFCRERKPPPALAFVPSSPASSPLVTPSGR